MRVSCQHFHEQKFILIKLSTITHFVIEVDWMGRLQDWVVQASA